MTVAENLHTKMLFSHEDPREYLKGRSILVTGATGSFGHEFVKKLLDIGASTRIVIFSRDELKQSVMSQSLSSHPNHPLLRFFIGDIREYDRLVDAMQGVQIVVHAAALKQVDTIEYNPFEAVKTNILGAQNVIRSCNTCKVQLLIALSTDKASYPGNFYGATKLCQDKLVIAGNYMYPNLTAAVVRYGNVFGSRGSVLPIFLKQARENGRITVTDPEMTRFTMDCSAACDFVINSIRVARGGEIFVPKLHSYRVSDLAQATKAALKLPSLEIVEIGKRPGEKDHEHMIASYESSNGCLEFEDIYVLLPPCLSHSESLYTNLRQLYLEEGGKETRVDFEYASHENSCLSVSELTAKIHEHSGSLLSHGSA